MTELRFPKDGYELRTAVDEDRPFFLECMRESILLSVDTAERDHSDLWMDDILSVTSIAMEGNMMRSELFILEDPDKERKGVLWMGISRDQFTCEETGYLLELFVSADIRGKGIGKALIGCAEEWCRQHGLLSLTLNVGSVNTAARDIYEHAGFGERSTVLRKRLR
ncbi:MAG: GNAT family N-acetyltransferase [Methanomassiliicoccaceae archaeon]|nr:GNAT family N-acetyltransferase [Methanomassiliicoccaceae archaeon]